MARLLLSCSALLLATFASAQQASGVTVYTHATILPGGKPALTDGTLPAAALDVFDREPPDPENPLFKLPNLVFSPHIAGVTAEAMDRMAVQAVQNIFSIFDGAPRKENAVNPEVFG